MRLRRERRSYKTRLVPVGTDLCGVLRAHVTARYLQRAKPEDPLFVTRLGDPLPDHLVQAAFRRLRVKANIRRKDHIRQPPRMHDLRHYLRSLTMSGGARAEFCATGELPIAWNGCLICHPT